MAKSFIESIDIFLKKYVQSIQLIGEAYNAITKHRLRNTSLIDREKYPVLRIVGKDVWGALWHIAYKLEEEKLSLKDNDKSDLYALKLEELKEAPMAILRSWVANTASANWIEDKWSEYYLYNWMWLNEYARILLKIIDLLDGSVQKNKLADLQYLIRLSG